MTKAEKLMEQNPLEIALSCERDGEYHEEYVAEFKPGYLNPLHIKSKDYNQDELGDSIIYLSHESAVELAKFLKDLFLDEIAE